MADVSVPALQATAFVHYTAWERAISDFVSQRTGQPADSLFPVVVGRSALPAYRAAHDRWVARADADLQSYLSDALYPLVNGFDLGSPPPAGHRTKTKARY
jgi:hypothetical protein